MRPVANEIFALKEHTADNNHPDIDRLRLFQSGNRSSHGRARASRAVFRAFAENHERTAKFRRPQQRWNAKRLDAEARPATPEAGVLPNVSFGLISKIASTFSLPSIDNFLTDSGLAPRQIAV